MKSKIPLKADVEVPVPPWRPDAAREGRPIEEAFAEAHEREARNEEAVERELAEKWVAELPPDDGEAGS
jgi:hypothetical protein